MKVARMSAKRGGLNGSTQHQGRTQLALKTKAKSLVGSDNQMVLN